MGPSPGDRIHLPCPPIVGRNCGIDARLTRDETRFDPRRERRLVPRRERIGHGVEGESHSPGGEGLGAAARGERGGLGRDDGVGGSDGLHGIRLV